MMRLFPVGNLVRLKTDELAVVTAEHPTDRFRPRVKILTNPKGETLEEAVFREHVGTGNSGEHPRGVVEAADPN